MSFLWNVYYVFGRSFFLIVLLGLSVLDAQESASPNFLNDKRNVAWGRAMGHHYFDIHFEEEDFLPAWPNSVVVHLNKLLKVAASKVEGTRHQEHVDYVIEGFDAFRNLLNQK